MDEVPVTGRRLRPQITMTVHPDTVSRMNVLCDRFKQSRGQVLDRLILILHRQYEDSQVMCMTGEVCRIGRRDPPEIF